MTRHTVKIWERGVNVSHVQRRLLAHLGELEGGVDGIYGPKTAAALGAFLRRTKPVASVGAVEYALLDADPKPRAEGARPCAGVASLAGRVARMPQGLGAFISGLGVSTTGTPAEFGARLRSAGVRWVAILRLWQERGDGSKTWNGSADKVLPYIRAAEDAGVAAYVWGWPVPGKSLAFAKTLAATARAWGAVGVIADCEEPWTNKRDDAVQLVRDIRAALPPGVSYGLTSYFSSAFPLVELCEVADFVIPQIYDSNNNLGPDYPKKALAKWAGVVADTSVIVPAFKTYNTTPEQMRTMVERIGLHWPALALWQWRTTSAAEWAAIEDLHLSEPRQET
jgi:peptidoglycan hydrolase-like protein with peptidoglycan-binding domain